jgi:hypothetical protein
MTYLSRTVTSKLAARLDLKRRQHYDSRSRLRSLGALDQFPSHPDLDDQKRQIIDRTLERIEQVTMMRDVDELLRNSAKRKEVAAGR